MYGGVNMNGKIFEYGTRKFQRVSRWTEIKYEFIGGAPYVVRNGQKHYLQHMIRIESPWINGKNIKFEDVTLSAIDTAYGYAGEYVEIDHKGERVRFYEDITWKDIDMTGVC